MSTITSGSAVERVREYIESLGMECGIDPVFVRELATELDQTRRQLIEARAAMYRIGVEVDLVMSNVVSANVVLTESAPIGGKEGK